MKLSIFTTVTNPLERGDLWYEAIENYCALADEVIIVNGGDEVTPLIPPPLIDKVKVIDYAWPQEFDWTFIGEQFQRGYEACSGDWVIHADLDYIFHERDFGRIRSLLEEYTWDKGFSFYKYQFLKWNEYTLKSRVSIAVNKGRYGDRIKFNSGGDLCQPSFDGGYMSPDSIPEAHIPFYNYDFLLKTQEQVKADFPRFARAWHQTFGKYDLGGPDDESAFQAFLQMMHGRYDGRATQHLDILDHPKIMQNTLRKLKPEQFGYNLWGYVDA